MGGISNHYIESILKPVCDNFRGVYSANTIPVRLLRCQSFSIVCNFSKVGERGTHFVTIIAARDRVLYIDSLGLPCVAQEINTFLRRLKKPVFLNSQQVQDFSSSFCGFYCILFVLYYDKKTPTFSLMFDTQNLLQNDSTCVKYIQQLLK